MIERSRLCSSDLSHVGTSDTHLQIYMHVHAQREARNQEFVGVSAQKKVLCNISFPLQPETALTGCSVLYCAGALLQGLYAWTTNSNLVCY